MPVSAGKSETVSCACCSGVNFKPTLDCDGFSFVRCVKCNLVQRNPRFKEEDIIARYKTSFGNDYLSYELKNEEAFLKLQMLALADAGFYKLEKQYFQRADKTGANADVSLIRNFSVLEPQVQEPSVLDIGCATGALLSYLRERGWRVTGVEISPSAEYAQKERSLDVKNIPLEKNNFPSESFNVIHASHLIEHLNDPKTFLDECFRVLKKDGTIFLTTPDISGFQARLFGSNWRSAIFDHLYLFSKSTLKKMLKNAGFKKIHFRTWGGLAAGALTENGFSKCLKKAADRLAKLFNCGDVMIVRAKKI